MKKIYHFLGGIYFAILLISSIALFVITGTFLESITASHRYASLFTYDNPLFTLLLGCLFINILFSATRRYPFKSRHIPFLTTHIGLLMILAGVFIKNAFGTQGAMFIIEGSSSDEITLNNRYEILMESRSGKTKFSLQAPSALDKVKVRVAAYAPHHIEHYETAIKEDHLYLANKKPIPLGVREHILIDSIQWEVLGLKNDSPLEEAEKIKEQVKTPLLLFIQSNNKLHFFAFDGHGRIEHQIIDHDDLHSYIAYDSGFGGYSIPLTFPYCSLSLAEEKAADLAFLKNNLRDSLKLKRQLSPPLDFFKNICQENSLDFPETCINFLVEWQKSQKLIYDTEDFSVISSCKSISEKELIACHWISVLLQQIEPRLVKEDLLSILEDLEWPLLTALKELAPGEDLLQALTYQIYAIAEELPEPKQINYPGLLSAYLRLYGIQFDAVSQMIERENPQEITFELPLSLKHTKILPMAKLEDNTPSVTLQIDDGKTKELVTLGYQRNGGGLKWPVLNGKYLLRFQSETQPIPYTVRLRNARQINYPGTDQAYSYESDLIFTDKRSKEGVEKTISMNRVHETWDGYRFYLSNISPGNETDIQRIQLAVNHDPAKYIVTYPGALIASLGIFLLFWMRPYGRKP